MKKVKLIFLLMLVTFYVSGQKQKLNLKKQTFELHNVTGAIIVFEGKEVLKIVRDLKALPFDVDNIEKTLTNPIMRG